MGVTIYQELWYSASQAFRLLIPEPKARVPITWKTIPHTFIYFIPFVFLAFLARRPDTHLIRVLILPSLISLALHCSFGYIWTDPRLNVYNWGSALCAFVVIAKSIDISLTANGRFKQGERTLGSMREPAVAAKADSDASGDASARHRPGHSFLPVWLEDALELIFSIRGLGWDFGRGVHVPSHVRPTERGPFLRATARSFITNFLMLDLLEALFKLIPGVGSVFGGSIFVSSLPPFQRYAFSTSLHFMTGCALLAGFNMVYDLLTLLAVVLLGHSPTAWPPIMDNPWISNSLHEFWAKRWHQTLRQTFLVFGGIPGRAIAGNLGLIFGTFLASGLYHECSIYAMGRGWDSRVPFFFVLQALALVGERVWRKATGRRVGGFFGRLWVYFNIIVLGQPLVDAWHRRGLAGAMIIPPPISPARLLLLPAIRSLTGWQL